jgi:hypothetical protein
MVPARIWNPDLQPFRYPIGLYSKLKMRTRLIPDWLICLHARPPSPAAKFLEKAVYQPSAEFSRTSIHIRDGNCRFGVFPPFSKPLLETFSAMVWRTVENNHMSWIRIGKHLFFKSVFRNSRHQFRYFHQWYFFTPHPPKKTNYALGINHHSLQAWAIKNKDLLEPLTRPGRIM